MKNPFKIKYLIITIVFISQSLPYLSQKNHTPFQGKLVYTIEIADTNFKQLYPPKKMTIYTNDTIVRIENESNQLGDQVIIKHTVLHKSILLLQAKNTFYAIQTNDNQETKNAQDTTQINRAKSNYIFKKKCGKRTITNLKANRMKVYNPLTKENWEFLYLKKYATKYVDAYQNLPGLPVKYYIQTEDGVFIYTLYSLEQTPVNRDLFGVPTKYKKVSFDQFFEEVTKEE